MALELMLSMLAHSAVLLENILPIDYIKSMPMCTTKGYAETPKKVTEEVDAPKSVDAVAAALCPSISELRGRHSQCQMAPRLPRSPNISVRFLIAIKSL